MVKNYKRIIVVLVSLILFSTVFVSSVGSKYPSESLIFTKTKNSSFASFLENLCNIFPRLAEIPLIAQILEFITIDDAEEGDSGDNGDGGGTGDDPGDKCQPEIEVIKKVKDSQGQWVEHVDGLEIGDFVDFKIEMNYDDAGSGYDILSLIVKDILPCCLEFVETLDVYSTSVYMDDPIEEISVDGKTVFWNWTWSQAIILAGGDSLTIEFRTEFVDYCQGIGVNLANITAWGCSGPTFYGEDDATVDCEFAPQSPEILIEKSASEESICVGQSVDYTYKITNIGDVELLNIQLFDDKLGPIVLPQTILLPSENMTVHVYDVILSKDTLNIATVSAETCQGQKVSNQSQAFVEVLLPSIDIIKEADIDIAEIGDTITYTYTVTNDGEVGISNIVVIDDLLGPVALGTNELEPTQSTSGQLTYVVQESDLPGPIINTAVVTGIADCDCQQVTDQDSETVELVLPCPPEVWVDDGWFSQTNVNQYNPDLIWQYNAFRYLQDGIDAVCDCGTVHVRAGSYIGQFFIDKSLELLGEPGAKIKGSNLETFTIDSSTETFKPIIFAYGGVLFDNNVVTTGNIGVTVDGFEIDGNDIPDAIAILYHNVQDMCQPSIISNNSISRVDIAIQINGCTDSTKIIYNKIYWESHDVGKIAVLISTHLDCEPSGVIINYNYWGIECGLNYGVINQASVIADARYNWWGADDGPASPNDIDNFDAITGRPADGYGDKVAGPVKFDPWYGVDSYSTSSNGPGNSICFDGTNSFAYDETGYINGSIKYKWDFDDGHYSFSKSICRAYGSPGIYSVSLMVEVVSYDLDPDFVYGYLRDWSYLKVVAV